VDVFFRFVVGGDECWVFFVDGEVGEVLEHLILVLFGWFFVFGGGESYESVFVQEYS
jgi:hypothetical protein